MSRDGLDGASYTRLRELLVALYADVFAGQDDRETVEVRTQCISKKSVSEQVLLAMLLMAVGKP